MTCLTDSTSQKDAFTEIWIPVNYCFRILGSLRREMLISSLNLNFIPVLKHIRSLPYFRNKSEVEVLCLKFFPKSTIVPLHLLPV
jgi:hypothetical protein